MTTAKGLAMSDETSDEPAAGTETHGEWVTRLAERDRLAEQLARVTVERDDQIASRDSLCRDLRRTRDKLDALETARDPSLAPMLHDEEAANARLAAQVEALRADLSARKAAMATMRPFVDALATAEGRSAAMLQMTLDDTINRAATAEAQVEALRGRLRTTAQVLVGAVGADGPMDAEDAAARAVSVVEALRAERDAAEAQAESVERGGIVVTWIEDGAFFWTWCPECGPNVMNDEDGCCAGCGRDATFYGETDAALDARIAEAVRPHRERAEAYAAALDRAREEAGDVDVPFVRMQRDALADALRKHGRHVDGCRAWIVLPSGFAPGDEGCPVCACGLDAALVGAPPADTTTTRACSHRVDGTCVFDCRFRGAALDSTPPADERPDCDSCKGTGEYPQDACGCHPICRCPEKCPDCDGSGSLRARPTPPADERSPDWCAGVERAARICDVRRAAHEENLASLKTIDSRRTAAGYMVEALGCADAIRALLMEVRDGD